MLRGTISLSTLEIKLKVNKYVCLICATLVKSFLKNPLLYSVLFC